MEYIGDYEFHILIFFLDVDGAISTRPTTPLIPNHPPDRLSSDTLIPMDAERNAPLLPIKHIFLHIDNRNSLLAAPVMCIM